LAIALSNALQLESELSATMPIRDRKAILAVSRIASRAARFCVIWALIFATCSAVLFGTVSISQADQDQVEARQTQAYQDYVKLTACIVAQNGLRAYLQAQARVSFDSCASKRFDVVISDDDRDYTVSGYATVLPPSGPSALRHFSVRIDHAPGTYPEWNFKVRNIEIDQ
jgi:hypothetical protein